ncbi:MAG: AarF/ABC1/UbiB kinase family protein [Deltaproteobacteria bacterium]|nr:AarF/ABC1/UbiB kinase family protein [Deltaproteobacteria bacterium]
MNFSQRDMAEELGVVHGAIGLWESGQRKIPGPVRKLMALYEQELGVGRPTAIEGFPQLEELETGWLARTSRLSATGLRVVGRTLMAILRERLHAAGDDNPIRARTQTAIARQLVETFGTLKGLPHKLGQLLSYMDLKASADVRAEYAQLQHLTPPMAPNVIAEILVEEFRQTPQQLFAEWESVPCAAASIGQVHRAKTHAGEAVAVKVQYPGIRKIIEADLKNAAVIERLGATLVRHVEPGRLLEELSLRFLEECNYELEGRHLERFRALHASDPRIEIPRVYPELTTTRVLTTAYVDATPYQPFRASATVAQRDFAGTVIWDHAWRSALCHRVFQADPHPGNYLFRDEAVVFLDYGCVKEIPEGLHAVWKAFLRSIVANDPQAMAETLVAMRIVPDPDKFDFAHFFLLMRAWYEPCYCDRPFTFTREFVAGRWAAQLKEYPQPTQMHFPHELLFINQLQWGLYAVLADLQATANWTRHFVPLLTGC